MRLSANKAYQIWNGSSYNLLEIPLVIRLVLKDKDQDKKFKIIVKLKKE